MNLFLLLPLLLSAAAFNLERRQLLLASRKPNHKAQQAANQQILRFPATLSLDNYVMLSPDFSGLEGGLSVCSWINKFLDSSAPHVFFSYATTRDTNEIALPDDLNYMDPRIALLESNKWYHYCFTIDFIELTMEVLIDGVQVLEAPIPAGSTIQSGGSLVLGQEQDSLGGGFQISQTFAGELYQMNVFKKRLSAEEVSSLSRCASSSQLETLQADIILSWEDLVGQQRHGAVSVVSGDCRGSGNEVELV